MTSVPNVAVLVRDIRRIPHLASFLSANVVRPDTQHPIHAVAGWGSRATALPAMRLAAAKGVPYWGLEDGFLRSVGLGGDHPTLSMVADDLGIYYDARRTSRLEQCIARPHAPDELEHARRIIRAWRNLRLSKYNHVRERSRSHATVLAQLPRRFVLALDQTFGDASIQYGLAGRAAFLRMLNAAQEENPDCTIVLKTHPEVTAGRKKGHVDLDWLSCLPRVQILDRDVNPAALLEKAEAVYAVTSQMGFEGLLWGKPVRTFGMPFYAGWGLTRDELPAPERRHAVTLEDLVYAALVEYPRYVDPETGQRCGVERIMEFIAFQKSQRERFPEGVYALGFSFWKKPIVRSFLQGSQVAFVSRAEVIPSGATVALWGRRQEAPRLPPDITVLRLEDGFLRSVGLGAEFTRPLSWVIDRRGIYYDATEPSDLETLLQETEFDAALIGRARALREALCTHGITKYNVGQPQIWQRPTQAKKVLLVPGQVETDASIRLGSPNLHRNLDLLKAVRAANPAAYIVYKPHPDVYAGMRKMGEGEPKADRWCDEIAGNLPLAPLFDTVDEIHVLTSLAGFEALLREKPVVVYGQPFYAGWGLTADQSPMPRRTRRLSLDELVAAALILYPTYVSRTTGQFTTPERALEELCAWRRERPTFRSFCLRLIARLFRND